MPEPYPWLAVDEVAILFGLSAKRIYSLAAEEKWLRGVGTTGNTIYATDDVLATKRRREKEAR